MTKKNTKTSTFEIDGRAVKQIRKYGPNCKKIWTKFKPLEANKIDRGPHFISDKPEQDHFDIYVDGKETVLKDRVNKPRSAGVVVVPGKEGTRILKLPQIEDLKENDGEKSDIDICHEYVTRVRVTNSDK